MRLPTSAIRTTAVAGLCGAGLLAAGLAFAAGPNDPVGPTDTSTRACFRVQQVDGFAARGIEGVNLRSHKDVYQAQFAVPCPEISESSRISIRSRSGTSYVCNGPDAELIAYSKITRPMTCTIRTLRKLSEAEIAALPKSEKP